MKLSSWLGVAALAATASITSLSPAQENQQSHGSAPAPTYAPPPPTYAPPPPGYGGGYATAPPPPMGPARMRYSEGDPVPPGYRVESRTRTGLVVGGSIMFGLLYGFTVFGASESSDPDAKWLYFPVVGPFIYASTIGDGYASGIGRFFLYVDGLIQAGGAAMLIVGLMGKTELVRNDIAKISVMPMVGRTNGLSLVGEF